MTREEIARRATEEAQRRAAEAVGLIVRQATATYQAAIDQAPPQRDVLIRPVRPYNPEPIQGNLTYNGRSLGPSTTELTYVMDDGTEVKGPATVAVGLDYPGEPRENKRLNVAPTEISSLEMSKPCPACNEHICACKPTEFEYNPRAIQAQWVTDTLGESLLGSRWAFLTGLIAQDDM